MRWRSSKSKLSSYSNQPHHLIVEKSRSRQISETLASPKLFKVIDTVESQPGQPQLSEPGAGSPTLMFRRTASEPRLIARNQLAAASYFIVSSEINREKSQASLLSLFSAYFFSGTVIPQCVLTDYIAGCDPISHMRTDGPASKLQSTLFAQYPTTRLVARGHIGRGGRGLDRIRYSGGPPSEPSCGAGDFARNTRA